VRVDPLGLATLADHLADWMLPGMTARMWRPRFLTAIAVTSLVVEPLAEELAKDGVTPPWLIFEWHYVEAVAALADREGNGLRRVPGIDRVHRLGQERQVVVVTITTRERSRRRSRRSWRRSWRRSGPYPTR
jgi:hypothetical protein